MATIYVYKCISERCKKFGEEVRSTMEPNTLYPKECESCKKGMFSRGQLKSLEEFRDREFKPRIIGKCRDCGRGIPAGYLAVVVKWASVVWGKSYTSQQPEVILCRGCAKGVITNQRFTARKAVLASNLVEEEEQVEQEEVELTPKEIAIKLMELFRLYKKPHSVEWLCKQAEIEVSDVVVAVLKALRGAGKIIRSEGKWLKA